MSDESVLRRSSEAWNASDWEMLEALWDLHREASGAPLEAEGQG